MCTVTWGPEAWPPGLPHPCCLCLTLVLPFSVLVVSTALAALSTAGMELGVFHFSSLLQSLRVPGRPLGMYVCYRNGPIVCNLSWVHSHTCLPDAPCQDGFALSLLRCPIKLPCRGSARRSLSFSALPSIRGQPFLGWIMESQERRACQQRISPLPVCACVDR